MEVNGNYFSNQDHGNDMAECSVCMHVCKHDHMYVCMHAYRSERVSEWVSE